MKKRSVFKVDIGTGGFEGYTGHRIQCKNCMIFMQFLCWILCNHQTHLYQCPLWIGSGGHTGFDKEIVRFSSNFYVGSCITANLFTVDTGTGGCGDNKGSNTEVAWFSCNLCWILCNHQTHLYQYPLWVGSGGHTRFDIEIVRCSWNFYVGSMS